MYYSSSFLELFLGLHFEGLIKANPVIRKATPIPEKMPPRNEIIGIFEPNRSRSIATALNNIPNGKKILLALSYSTPYFFNNKILLSFNYFLLSF